MMTLPTDYLDLAILLYKSLSGREVSARQVSGVLPDSYDLSAVVARLEAVDGYYSHDPLTRHLEWNLPNNFFLSLDEVLLSPARRIKALAKFYLAEQDATFSDGDFSKSPQVESYIAATKLYALLEQVSDHQGGIGAAKTLIFLHHGKLEITPDYGVVHLCKLEGLDAFGVDFIASQTHREQKSTILKTVLLELFAGKKKLPFSDVLARFDDLKEKVQVGYQLYVAEFSFQRVKAEVEKEKLDAMLKLNKVFSDIQNQLLAVPAALILAGGQMKEAPSLDFKNLIIWLGALVFSVFMMLLIRNQRHTLRAVKEEIEQQKLQLQTKFYAVASRFKDVYEEIDVRHRHQAWLIQVVDVLVALTFCFITALLVSLSPYLQTQLAGLWTLISRSLCF